MRIPNENMMILLTLDLPLMSSPKLNAHKQGRPRNMFKSQITIGLYYELLSTELRKHTI